MDLSQGWTSLNKNQSWSWGFLAPIILPELELELFSSNYSPRAGNGDFRLKFFVTRAGAGVFGSEFFHRAGAGARVKSS